MAACIGREFAFSLLAAAVSPLPEVELCVALDRLMAAELVFGRGELPEARYTFKHALVPDAAHASLLRSQRRQLHARIVWVLEERFPETADTEPEVLARHCAEAGLAERAAELAAGRATGARALRDGRGGRAPDRGLKALPGVPGGAERQQRELSLQLTSAFCSAWSCCLPQLRRGSARGRSSAPPGGRLEVEEDAFAER